MFDFIFYKLDTGEITHSCSCTERVSFDNAIQEAGSGKLAVKATFEDGYVREGVYVAYTDEQKAVKVAQPTAFHEWSNFSMTWTDTRSAEQLELERKTAITRQIAMLEVQVTARRLRDALVNGDHSFVSNIESQIAALRATL